ncbi:MAG TPA: FHA domain-containing protein [Baekduia sp.]|nr:FHA domain-containing protein [Baekduia sp.]
MRPPAATPVELKRLVELDRGGTPYLVHRDPGGTQVETVLDGAQRLSIGRDPACDIALPWDPGVSRLHAELEHVAGSWVVVDDGLSRNGTWIGEHRIAGRHRLADGEVLRTGATLLRFRDPAARPAEATVVEDAAAAPPQLSAAQRRVLVALCRPFADGGQHALPATNKAIADELVLSEDAIKTHLRTLFTKFDVGDLPQNAKRARLAELALVTGIVTPADLA